MAACKNWEDRLPDPDNAINRTLLEEISNHKELSTFKDLLVQTGYDKVLASSKSYTVWAPANEALASLPASVLNDPNALKVFVGNHIALQLYNMPVQDSKMVEMLNGKYNIVKSDKFGTASLVTSNQLVSNGVLHTISSFVSVLPSVWEYLSANTTYKQNLAIANLTQQVFNPSKAIIDSISATTGLPIYRPGTGYESVNTFTNNVYDLKNESKRYTYFLMTNDLFDKETAKLVPYFKAGGDTTNTQTAYNTARDLVIEGDYTAETLPAVLKSKFGVTLTIDKNAIVSTMNLSNGTIFIMNALGVNISEKFQPIVVQGESYNQRMNVTLASTVIANRRLLNPLTNNVFTSISVIGHGNSGFWLQYNVPNVPSMKYKVYWVVVNDLYATNTAVGETATFAINQKLAMGSLASATFPYPAAALPVKNYSEQLLGEYTVNSFGTLSMFLVANGTNAMALDYVKLVPVLQ
jgi:hypothetical protein